MDSSDRISGVIGLALGILAGREVAGAPHGFRRNWNPEAVASEWASRARRQKDLGLNPIGNPRLLGISERMPDSAKAFAPVRTNATVGVNGTMGFIWISPREAATARAERSLTRPQTYNRCGGLLASLQNVAKLRQRLRRVAESSVGGTWRKGSELTSSILRVPAGTVRWTNP